MEIHSVQDRTIQGQIEKIKKGVEKRPLPTAPFVDPIREFSRASQVEGMVRNWLTYPIEERRRLIREAFGFIPRRQSYVDEHGVLHPEETEQNFEARKMERWRALCVIIQEESRAQVGNRSPEVAIGALKHLFPDYDWKTKPQATPPEK